jgi:hypothetical protein
VASTTVTVSAPAWLVGMTYALSCLPAVVPSPQTWCPSDVDKPVGQHRPVLTSVPWS